jgi:hypothetical protein
VTHEKAARRGFPACRAGVAGDVVRNVARRCCAIGVAVGLLAAIPAAADGPVGLRFIARGVSDSGQRWVQRARADRGQLITEISLPLARGEDGGGFISGPLVSQQPIVFSQGNGLGSADECELDGYAYKTVATVRIDTPAGALTFRPRRAPRAALRRWPQLRRARFFVRFFPTDDCPTGVTVFDINGRVLEHHDLG